jgi:hypothetical protein
MSKGWSIVLTILITGLVIGGGVYFYIDTERIQDLNELEAQINDLQLEITQLKNQTNNLESSTQDQDSVEADQDNEISSAGTIKGSLSYPSEFIPAYRICAVDTSTMAETCTVTERDQKNYSIKVEPGDYFVKAVAIEFDDWRETVYHTRCDARNKPTICDDRTWDSDTICFNHDDCKKAHTVRKISVSDDEVVNNVDIEYGWYVPSGEQKVVENSKGYTIWEYYIDWD